MGADIFPSSEVYTMLRYKKGLKITCRNNLLYPKGTQTAQKEDFISRFLPPFPVENLEINVEQCSSGLLSLFDP